MRLKTYLRKNTLVLLNVSNERYYENAKRIIDRIYVTAQNCKVISFSLERPLFLKGLKIECGLSEDFLSETDYKLIDKHTIQDVPENWYRFNFNAGCDITKFDNLDLGRLIEDDFQHFLIPRIKNLWVTKKVLDAYQADSIVVIEDTGELAESARLIAGQNKIKCFVVKFSPYDYTFLGRYKRLLRYCLVDISLTVLNIISGKLLERKKDSLGKILVDNKIISMSKIFYEYRNFLPMPFDAGVRVRMDLLKKGQAYLPFYFKNRKCIFAKKKYFLGIWRKIRSHKSFQSYFTFQGVPYWNLVSNKLRRFYFEDFPRIEKNIRIAKRYILPDRIKAVLLRHDYREFERTIAAIAKQRGIPTLVIQHGVVAEENYIYYKYVYVDAMFVWGKACKKWFKLNDEKQKLFVTGNPRYDAYLNWKSSISKAELFHNLGLESGKTTILFATQAIVKFSSYRTDDENEVLARKILDFIKTKPQYQLIIKIHPYEEEEIYQKRVEESGAKNVGVIKDINIFDLLINSDILIMKNSTTGLEAMLFDKPVVTIDLSKRRDQVSYGEEKAAISIHSYDEIAAAISDSVGNASKAEFLRASRLKFINNYAYKSDGLASRRIINKLEEILENGLDGVSCEDEEVCLENIIN